MIADYLYPLACFFIIIYLLPKIKFFSSSGLKRNELRALFTLKVIVGIVLCLIYTYYYTDRLDADIFKYYDDGAILANLAKKDIRSFFSLFFGIESGSYQIQEALNEMNYWSKTSNFGMFNDNQTAIRMNAFFHLFSFGSFHFHSLLFSLLSFTGIIGLYRFFNLHFSVEKWLLIFALFVFPSFLFWSSGALKESILLFQMGLIFYFAFCSVSKWRWLFLIGLLMSCYYLKFYVLLCLIPSFLFLLLVERSKLKSLPSAALVLGFSILALIFLKIVGLVDVFHFIAERQEEFAMYNLKTNAGSYFFIPSISSLSDFMCYWVIGFLNVLFRPFVWEANSLFGYLASFENLFILFLLVLNSIFYKKGSIQKWPIFSFIFVLTFSILIGLTTPNFGA
ncbi:MAG: hypothetical protein AAF487_12360, partial [Bacteroidota bacterium]